MDQEMFQMIATEAGILAAVLGVAVTALWKANSSVISRVMDKQENLITNLTGEQNKATAALAESVHRVETAVVRSDTANVAALGALKDSVNARLDSHEDHHKKHEARFLDFDGRFKEHDGRFSTLDGALALHEHRIKVIESSEVWKR